MAKLRGISEKTLYVYNPLPQVTDHDLLIDSGLDMIMEPGKRSPFRAQWDYGAGHERETIYIEPGEFFAMRESDAKEFVSSANHTELGYVVVNTPNADDPEVKKAAITGLRKALAFYRDRGDKRIITMRKVHGLSEDEINEQRADYWCYFYSAAQARAIQHEIERLSKVPSKKAAQ